MSKITVTTIAGQTSGADANKVKIESGDTLEVTSNATVGGTLGVTGTSVLTGNVGIGTSASTGNNPLVVQAGSGAGGINLHGRSSDNTATMLIGKSSDGNTAYNTITSYANRMRIQSGFSSDTNTMEFFTNDVSRVVIDASGRVTEPLQPSFKAVGTNAGYITTTPVQFPNTSLGEGHNVGGHYNTSTHKFTAPVAGRYLFHLHMGIIRITSNGGNGYPYIRVNDAAVNYSYFGAPTATVYGPAHITQILQLAANDYVNVTFAGTNAQYYGNYTELSFSGYLLG